MIVLVAALAMAGQLLPVLTLPDDEGQPHVLPRAGQALVVVYEDQEGGKLNAATKALIAAYHDPVANRAKVDVWPIADLSQWNFWPARSSALKQVRLAAQKANSRILVDWTGACQKAWGAKKGTSTVIVVGADGHVLFSTQGDESDAQRELLEATLHELGLAK